MKRTNSRQVPVSEASRDLRSRWHRDASARFVFGERHLDFESGKIRLVYRLDGLDLTETFRIPQASRPESRDRLRAIEAALQLLHWVAGVSYWKAGCPDQLEHENVAPDSWQSEWLNKLYRQGLAEFAWHNRLDPQSWPLFSPFGVHRGPGANLGLGAGVLAPMGGGKDSLVALERLRNAGLAPITVQVGNAELIRQVAEVAGSDHLVIERRLDPVLGELNQQGAWNGHVPVTAINAAVLILVALVHDCRRIVFANERSADEATLTGPDGQEVNHQFSKSLEFERMLDAWVRYYIAEDLEVFSILRRDRELAVCREFAGLTKYHTTFSSCNRNFHLEGARTGRWCGQCPKCHFVFLALAPFMASPELRGIFGRNLLADQDQIAGFRALLGLDGTKPFECVGEAVEARAALGHLVSEPGWREMAVVAAVAPELEGMAVPSVDELCRPGGEHLIPDELLSRT